MRYDKSIQAEDKPSSHSTSTYGLLPTSQSGLPILAGSCNEHECECDNGNVNSNLHVNNKLSDE